MKEKNCVFVGYDKENKPRYAGLRGTNTNSSFKGEVEGSQKNFLSISKAVPIKFMYLNLL